MQSESGFLSITGSPEAPAKAGCSTADIAAGMVAGMVAYSHILAALLQRQASGRGGRQRRARSGSRRAARDHRDGFRPARRGAAGRPARGGRHRQRPRQHHGRRLGPPAAGRAPALDACR
jgi:hypothetical protein